MSTREQVTYQRPNVMRFAKIVPSDYLDKVRLEGPYLLPTIKSQTVTHRSSFCHNLEDSYRTRAMQASYMANHPTISYKPHLCTCSFSSCTKAMLPSLIVTTVSSLQTRTYVVLGENTQEKLNLLKSPSATPVAIAGPAPIEK